LKIFKPSFEFKSRVEFKFPQSYDPLFEPKLSLVWSSKSFDLDPSTKVQIIIFREVQTSDWISKSFEIYLNSFKSSSQNFENCFPVPILLLAQPPCSPSLFSLYFHSKLFDPLAFEAHLPTQPQTPCVFFNLRREENSNGAAATKTSPPAKASSRLRNMELTRLDILSFFPHSIEDFPFVSPPKTDKLRQLQCTPMLMQLLRLSTHLAIPRLYKSAHTFTDPPRIHFGHQLTSSLLPSPLQ
jgi:hypothetical protein